MRFSTRAFGTGVVSVALLSGCVFDGSQTTDASQDEVDPVPGISVTVPPERLTPFCQAMTDLTDRIRSDDGVTNDEIVETYRSILDDVPAVIAGDFALVLDALETGTPVPTDPPRATIETLPRPETTPPPAGETTTSTSSSTSSTTASTASATLPGATGEAPADSSVPDAVVVDERYDRDDTPAERINSYVSFACRDTDNNPGPPATQPLEAQPSSDG